MPWSPAGIFYFFWQVTYFLLWDIFNIFYLYVFPIDLHVYSPSLVISYSMHIYALFGAVTCIFLANILAIFCQGNRSGYIGVCKNYKIKDIRNTNFVIIQKYKSKIDLVLRTQVSVICQEHLKKKTFPVFWLFSNVGRKKCLLAWKVNKRAPISHS